MPKKNSNRKRISEPQKNTYHVLEVGLVQQRVGVEAGGGGGGGGGAWEKIGTELVV